MHSLETPRWIRFLERKIPFLAVPQIVILLLTLQGAGSLFVMIDPIWIQRLSLEPAQVLKGEFWRLIMFLALPLSTSPIWIFFSLWFLYFVVTAIENEWGAFKTTLYVLVSVLLTIAFSFAFQYPIRQISGFESTLFLAAATLFPEMDVQLFMVVPVKMKWLANLTLIFLLYQFAIGHWTDRFYLLAIYSNYFLFFGPALFYRVKQFYRKWKFKYLNKLD